MVMRFLMLLTLVCVAASACVSREPAVVMGIQPKYSAINPSRILAVPIFILPNPAHPANIEPFSIESAHIVPLIESFVLGAFKDQPSVNGVSFDRVRKDLGKNQPIWVALDKELSGVSARLHSRDPQDHSTFSESCKDRKNVEDFYVYCVIPDKAWKAGLNALSAKILNADSALIVLLTDLEKKEVDGRYQIQAEVSVLLVDTNNGNLIWGREASDKVVSDPAKKVFPEWQVLFAKMLSEPFWNEFPGRKIKS